MQNTDDSHKMSTSLLNGVFNEKKQSKKPRSNEADGSSCSSSSSHGDVLVLRASSSSGEEEKSQPRLKKTKRSKKPLARHQFLVEDEDDERTDSADEGDKTLSPAFTQSHYPQPMLRPLSPTMMSVGYGAALRPTHIPAHKDDVIDMTPGVLEPSRQDVPRCNPLSPDMQQVSPAYILYHLYDTPLPLPV